MLYREVPKNGDKLSVLGYGCMRLPMRMQSINQKLAEKQILYAMDQGVNYFDTAYPYHNGKSEPFLGKVISNNGYPESSGYCRPAICGIQRHGRHYYGTFAGREPGQNTTTVRERHLGQGRPEENAGGLVPGMDLESPGGHRDTFRYEQR